MSTQMDENRSIRGSSVSFVLNGVRSGIPFSDSSGLCILKINALPSYAYPPMHRQIHAQQLFILLRKAAACDGVSYICCNDCVAIRYPSK